MRRACVYFRPGAGGYQYGVRSAGGGGADYILPAKRNHPDDFGVPHQPVWSAQSGDLDAGQGAGLEICHSGQSVWVKYGAHIEDKDLGVYMELVLFLSCYIYA